MDVGFTINRHDSDGDITQKCIMLHFDKHLILELADMKVLASVIKQLKKIEKEIKENYSI